MTTTNESNVAVINAIVNKEVSVKANKAAKVNEVVSVSDTIEDTAFLNGLFGMSADKAFYTVLPYNRKNGETPNIQDNGVSLVTSSKVYYFKSSEPIKGEKDKINIKNAILFAAYVVNGMKLFEKINNCRTRLNGVNNCLVKVKDMKGLLLIDTSNCPKEEATLNMICNLKELGEIKNVSKIKAYIRNYVTNEAFKALKVHGYVNSIINAK